MEGGNDKEIVDSGIECERGDWVFGYEVFGEGVR